MKKQAFYIIIAGAFLFGSACCFAGTPKKQKINYVKENFDFAGKQLRFAFKEVADAKAKDTPEARKERQALGQGDLVSPRNTEPDGSLHLVASSDWTSGFFPGELWMMYEYTKDNFWKKKAELFTDNIEDQKMNGKTHDMGFKMYCSFGNGYRLTKDNRYKDILLQSAKTMATRFKPNAGIIRSWDHHTEQWDCPVIIDNMMNLELLFWATKISGDSTYYKIAERHALTTMKNHFRPDFSCYHVVDYDTISGNVIKKNTHQGYADHSAWARGQAWALYGYTLCYRETHRPEFLQHAINVENYIFSHKNMPADLIAYWDFDAPNIPNEPRDASAAAVMASALYELSQYVPADKAKKYKKEADTIIENLTKNYRATVGKDNGFLLLHSTGTKPTDLEVDVPLVYADYYFLEALLRKEALEK